MKSDLGTSLKILMYYLYQILIFSRILNTELFLIPLSLKLNMNSEKEKEVLLSDVQIIEQVRSGEKEKFALLVQRYQPKLLGFFYRMTGSLEESEDLSQETFINTYFNLQKFDATKEFYPWIFTIAHHLAVNRYHRNKKIRLIDIEKVPELEDKDNLFESVLRRESRDIIQKMLLKLRGEYRLVLELRYLKEKSYEEIAQDLSLPLNTVKSRLFRAKSILAKVLEN